MAGRARKRNEIFPHKGSRRQERCNLIYGGAEIKRLEKSLQAPTDGDVYAKLKGKLTDYFASKKNVHYAQYLFFKMRPQTGESTVSYAVRLQEKATNCDFHDRDERILE